MTLNLSLASRLAIQNLRNHRMVSAATILGVAIGMTVVSAVLIVDHNTARTAGQRAQLDRGSAVEENPITWGVERLTPEITSIEFGRGAEEPSALSVAPTQEEQTAEMARPAANSTRRGEEDYQAMRLAVRLASLLAFSIGAVIVFYTMRFSVASRSRALSLLVCLGEFRSNINLSLVVEAFLLGSTGTFLGLLLGIPTSRYLLLRDISTTGRVPLEGFAIPPGELAVMAVISIAVALLGIAGPVRGLNRTQVSAVLQPRFLAEDMRAGEVAGGLVWAVPPLLAATYLIVRPFLFSWLSVVQFFLFEGVFVVGLDILTLWWVQPLLRFILHGFEVFLRPFFPLETLLTGRRMRLMSQKIASSIIGITLVFSLLAGLDDVTRALKAEIAGWAGEAVLPYAYFLRTVPGSPERAAFEDMIRREGVYLFRLSSKVSGEFPMRLVRGNDVNPYRQAQGRPSLRPGTVVLSRTLAARFGIGAGEEVEVRSDGAVHRFEVIEIADDLGFFPRGGSLCGRKILRPV